MERLQAQELMRVNMLHTAARVGVYTCLQTCGAFTVEAEGCKHLPTISNMSFMSGICDGQLNFFDI